MTTMKTRIVRIGNSQGIRIPKLALDQTGLGEEVELELQEDCIVIRPAHYPRSGWEDAFKAMAERDDDRLPDADVLASTTWEQEEWEW
jgi:antitoxin MazE